MNGADATPLARGIARIARSLTAGMAMFWVVAIVLVRGEAGVPDWWLPVALLLGALMPPPALPPWSSPRTSSLWRLLVFVVLAVAVGAMAYGALATPSRHWDGVVAFDAKAHWLAATPTLKQPYFTDPAVFHYGPDYPLLLPLLLASTERLLGGGLGRVWLAVIYLALLATIVATAWRAGWSRRLTTLLVVAFGLTPELLGPGGGAVDSGYADTLLLLATTTLAAGLLLASPVDLAIGVLLAVACKPEGLAYVGVAAVAAFVAGQRRSFLTIAGACAVGLVAWLPAQRQLLHQPARGFPYELGLAAGVLVAFGVIAVVGATVIAATQRRRHAVRARALVAIGIAVVIFAALPLLAYVIPPDSAIGVYVHRGEPSRRGLANLLAWALAFVHFTVLRVDFGATFVLVALLVCWRRRDRADDWASLGLPVFLGAGLLSTSLAFVLSHEGDVQHHLRSSLPRLLLHWLGPAWLFLGSRLDALLSRAPAGAVVAGAAS